ncbi:MAG: dihydrolipoamide dehydrogenase [Ilumatobacteraceae bacterium]|nr:dihydrolipoamide dehydrogenase [Ilumatobacteraceae bacterium]
MVVGEIPVSADLVVIGAGPGGYAAALRGAQLGRDVVLIERDGPDGIGGVCLNVGCIPSKALIEAANHLQHTRAMTKAGLVVDGARVDMSAWQQWKSSVVDGLTGGIRQLLRSAGVSVITGHAQLSRPDQLVVTDPLRPLAPAQYFQFTDLVLATGSRPAPLPGLTRDGIAILDSTDVLAVDHLPERIAVIGAGYIGLELGTALAKLGAAVTIIECAGRVLPTMDAMFARPIERRLRQLGIDLRLGTAAVDFVDGVLRLAPGDTIAEVGADIVVVAVGRVPNTDQLGLDAAGIAVDERGLVPVGGDRRATRHIAAIGDIVAGPALAHKATAEARVAVEALCGHAAAFSPTTIPAVVFCDPEIASAGSTADDARTAGLDVDSVTIPMGSSGRAATMDARDGFLQLVWERDTQAVIGVHIAGAHASELIAEGVLAIEMAATLEDIAGSIHAHPTLSEQLGEAAHLALGRPVHVPVRK